MPRAICRVAAVLLLLTAGAFAAAQSSDLYSATADAHSDIAQAIRTAIREHKRIILDFGGNWCGDCQVLNIYFHQPPNEAILEKHFVVVRIDVGLYDRNLDVAKKYRIQPDLGVPALAVLNQYGRLLYSQQRSVFRDMQHVNSASVTDFLNKWK